MLSSRADNGIRSARKYVLPIPPSPLSRDSTMTIPIRNRRRVDDYSTSNHTHGLGGEAREAMLRSGLRMKRTSSSLRVVATKGNATLSAAFYTITVPDLDVYRRRYMRKEDEFAETIPSALSPFQFVTKDNTNISQWRRSSSDENIQPDAEEDPEKVDDWLQEMRMKVHIRLAQKQQFCNMANPIETQPTHIHVEATPVSARNLFSSRGTLRSSRDGRRGSLHSSSRGSLNSSRSADDAKKKDRNRSDKELNLDEIPQSISPKRPASTALKHLKDKKEKRSSLPPLSQKPSPLPDVAGSLDKTRLSKVSSSDTIMPPVLEGPLFYPRPGSVMARRTCSEQDVRRLRASARNSVGLEPIAA